MVRKNNIQRRILVAAVCVAMLIACMPLLQGYSYAANEVKLITIPGVGDVYYIANPESSSIHNESGEWLHVRATAGTLGPKDFRMSKYGDNNFDFAYYVEQYPALT
jgi:hypothetical protein